VSTEGDMRRYRAEANKHRADISKASKIVATQRKKATDAMTAAGKTKSAATARSKLAEAERATKAANDAEGKRAGLERKLADAEVKIAKTQERYEKERNASQAKALDDLRKRADLASLSSSRRDDWESALPVLLNRPRAGLHLPDRLSLTCSCRTPARIRTRSLGR
jgi:hypothetical protein